MPGPEWTQLWSRRFNVIEFEPSGFLTSDRAGDERATFAAIINKYGYFRAGSQTIVRVWL